MLILPINCFNYLKCIQVTIGFIHMETVWINWLFFGWFFLILPVRGRSYTWLSSRSYGVVQGYSQTQLRHFFYNFCFCFWKVLPLWCALGGLTLTVVSSLHFNETHRPLQSVVEEFLMEPRDKTYERLDSKYQIFSILVPVKDFEKFKQNVKKVTIPVENIVEEKMEQSKRSESTSEEEAQTQDADSIAAFSQRRRVVLESFCR